MTAGLAADPGGAEDLFEHAPCGYVVTRPDGTIVRANRTFHALTGLPDAIVAEGRRFQDLLTVGGRIYYETHYAPLLQMQGAVREVAVEIRGREGARIPVLLSSELHRDALGAPHSIRTIVFEATDRRRYEEELRRARDREREIAQRLQRSMLGGAMPQDATLDLAVTYLPAEDGLAVGGDWYDAFWVGPRSVALVVGDVVGRGIGPATTMAQLRSATRALAATGRSPAAVLDALDGYAQRYGVGEMTTVAYLQLDLDTGRMVSAAAGHPPPAVAAPGAEPQYVWEGRSAPLDAGGDPTGRAEVQLALAPGSVVLLFSDGLVERVDRSLQDRLDRLLRELGARSDAGVDELVLQLPAAMADGHRLRDDVCLMAAGWSPEQRGRPAVPA